MDDEEENIEFCLPSNTLIEPFFHLNNEKKTKVIELGLMCFTQTNDKIHYWNKVVEGIVASGPSGLKNRS